MTFRFRWPVSLGWVAVTAALAASNITAQDAGSAARTPRGIAANQDRDPAAAAALARLPISFRRIDTVPATVSASTSDLDDPELPLAPRSHAASSGAMRSSATGNTTRTVISSLAIVTGLLLIAGWFARRRPGAAEELPDDVFQYLGTTLFNGRQTVHVVRFGEKLLLVATTSTGLQTLSELTRPDDVQRLTALCRPGRVNPIASKLHRVLAEWTHEPTGPRANPRTVNASAATGSQVGDPSHA